MGRVEEYKYARTSKRRFALCFFICIFILVAGMAIVDYSTNQLLNTGDRFSIFSFEEKGDSIKVGFMNKYFYFDTRYLNRDFNKLRQKLRIW